MERAFEHYARKRTSAAWRRWVVIADELRPALRRLEWLEGTSNAMYEARVLAFGMASWAQVADSWSLSVASWLKSGSSQPRPPHHH